MDAKLFWDIFIILGFFILFFLWSRENEKRRDYSTELSSLIHKYDLDSRDLRRSLRHKEIRKEVEKNYDLPEEFVDKMKKS